MSYSLLITRNTDHPFVIDPDNPSKNRIRQLEWNAVVDADKNLKQSPETQATDNWFYVSIPTPSNPTAKYTASIVDCRQPTIQFAFNELTGTVILKDPSPSGIEKSLAIADSLDAIVRGYDGEIYSSGTEWNFHPSEPTYPETKTHWITPILEKTGFASFLVLMVAGAVWRGMIGFSIGALIGFFLVSALFLIAISRNQTANGKTTN